jgi:hypothetical protein
MLSLAFRVVSRFERESGVFQAPPGLYEDILGWLQAVVAANVIQETTASLKGLSEPTGREGRFEPLLTAVAALEAAPTSWKAYVAVYDLLWIWGHPGARKSVKDFQKLTPEKKASLAEDMLSLVASVRKLVTEDQANEVQDRAKAKAEKEALIEQVRPYLRPDVEAMTGTDVDRFFSINLKGRSQE